MLIKIFIFFKITTLITCLVNGRILRHLFNCFSLYDEEKIKLLSHRSLLNLKEGMIMEFKSSTLLMNCFKLKNF